MTSQSKDKPDFVIKRKRKRPRQAIDPCLGFYKDLVQSSPMVFTQPRTASELDSVPSDTHTANQESQGSTTERESNASARALKRKIAVSEIVDSDLGQALTVEEFLRRSATSTKWFSTRRSRRLRRNLVPLRSEHTAVDNDSDSDYQPDSAESSPYLAGRSWTNDEDDLIPEKPAKKRRRRRQTKSAEPLSARILAAAIATGVDVVGGPFLPVSSSAPGVRRPLPLIAVNRAAFPTGVKSKVKPERRHFVDPRKETPFDRAVFQFRQVGVDGEDPTADAEIPRKPKASRPVTAWMPDGDTFALLTNAQVTAPPRRSIKKASPSAAVRPVAVPLNSVDAAKRQKRGQTIFKPFVTALDGDGESHETHEAPSLVRCSLTPGTPTATASLDHESSFFVPNSSLSTTSSPATVLMTSLSPSADDTPRGSVNCNPSFAPLDVVSSANQPQSRSCSKRKTIEHVTSSNLSFDLRQKDFGEVMTTALRQLPASTVTTERTIKLPHSAPRKPLRSLVSMLDSFREIARSAIQKSMASERGATVRSHPSTAVSPTSARKHSNDRPPSPVQTPPLDSLPSRQTRQFNKHEG